MLQDWIQNSNTDYKLEENYRKRINIWQFIWVDNLGSISKTIAPVVVNYSAINQMYRERENDKYNNRDIHEDLSVED